YHRRTPRRAGASRCAVLASPLVSNHDDRGPRAWHSGDVPHHVTCNTYIAQTYAEVVMAYLRELARTGKLVANEPIYVVELAAGVGAFAWYFIRKLSELKQESSLCDLDVRYVMTDFTSTKSQHPQLARFAAAGILGFGKFDVDGDQQITLVGGGVL